MKMYHQYLIIFVLYFYKQENYKKSKCLFTNIQKQQNMLKISLSFKKSTNSMGNVRIFMIKNVEFSGYYFHMNLNIQGYFQICISLPLENFSI